jgi:hypothetical protein
VKKILEEDPYVPAAKPLGRVYREACKRSMSPAHYWTNAPGDYKGTKLQWVMEQDFQKSYLKEMQKPFVDGGSFR